MTSLRPRGRRRSASALSISILRFSTTSRSPRTFYTACPPVRRSAARSTKAWVQEQLAAVGAEFDSRMRVSDLSVAQRQLVEIAKALALKPKVLVLDEPTEALTAAETERLFLQIARIKAIGTAVVYISHRLPEVRRIADRISILRDGRFRGTFSAAGVSEEEILALIIGRSVDTRYPAKMTRTGDGSSPCLSPRISAATGCRASMSKSGPARSLGLAGVEGNGQRDFIRGLAGLTTVSGEIAVRGRPCGDLGSCRGAERRHHLSARRPACGRASSLPFSSRESDPSGARYADAFRARLARARARAGGLLWRLACDQGAVAESDHCESVRRQSAESLFARSMAADPAVFLADEPTRGVDAGARMELYRITRDVAAKGAGGCRALVRRHRAARASATACWFSLAARSCDP